MYKKVLNNKEAFEKMMKGLDLVADATTATMGPRGRNVYLNDRNGIENKITNDGVSVANKIFLEDSAEDAGAWIIRNISAAQNDIVGDGTTLVSLLTQKVIHECLKRPESPMEIRESIKEAGEKMLKVLRSKSIAIKKEDIKKVALISAEDETLATKISEIVHKLGEKAVINVEDSQAFETDYEIVNGYEANVGFMSPHFITDKKNSRAVHEDIFVFCSQKKMSSVMDIKPLFDKLQEEKISSLVVVCEEIDDSILGIFVTNKMLGRMNLVVIRATGPLLQDIAGVVGANIVSDATGITFQNFALSSLGKAKKIVCDANKTIFIGDGIASKNYAKELEAQAQGEPNQFTKKMLEKRIAKLGNGIAILRIASPTDTERGYLRDKAEDAVKATTAALEEGIVEGGGMTLWRMAQELKPKTIGEEILKKVLVAPLKKIIENAGKDYTETILNSMQGYGYDAKGDKWVKMFESGIIDPHKVIRCALENAISSASAFITINSLVVDIPEVKT